MRRITRRSRGVADKSVRVQLLRQPLQSRTKQLLHIRLDGVLSHLLKGLLRGILLITKIHLRGQGIVVDAF